MSDIPLTPMQERALARAKAAFPWHEKAGYANLVGKGFQPGKTGNPGGLSRFYHEARRLAREAAPEMIRQAIELAKTAEDERVKSVCIFGVLDRAGIKPIDFDPNEAANAAANMPLEERKARLAELMQRAATILGLQVELAPAEPAESGGSDQAPSE